MIHFCNDGCIEHWYVFDPYSLPICTQTLPPKIPIQWVSWMEVGKGMRGCFQSPRGFYLYIYKRKNVKPWNHAWLWNKLQYEKRIKIPKMPGFKIWFGCFLSVWFFLCCQNRPHHKQLGWQDFTFSSKGWLIFKHKTDLTGKQQQHTILRWYGENVFIVGAF